MNRLHAATSACALLLAGAAMAAPPAPRLGKALLEQRQPVAGRPGAHATSLQPLPRDGFRYANGEYRSAGSGLALRLPRLLDEQVVSVREGAVAHHEDGTVGAWRLVFVPNAQGTGLEKLGPMSAVVASPMRGDQRPDAESLLKSLEPATPQLRRKLEARGLEFRRLSTALGEALETVVPNRFAAAGFPQQTHIDETVDGVRSVGVTRRVVVRDKALLEFSQIYPCRQLAADACKAAARSAADRFVQGVVAYEPAQASNKGK